jgi:hypothetical protein
MHHTRSQPHITGVHIRCRLTLATYYLGRKEELGKVWTYQAAGIASIMDLIARKGLD